MKKQTQLPIPAKRVMHKVGSDIRDARLRRRLPMVLIAERAGISRITLRKIENGETSVSLGSFVSVLFALGMIDRLQEIADASHDHVGRQLEEEQLPQRIRIQKNKHHE